MDNPETLATLCTKDTGRRQTKQINVIENTKGAIKNGQSRDTGNIVYKGHRTKTNKTNKRYREHRRFNQEWTIQRHCQYCVQRTQDEDKQNK
jgi:hypothetical protein